MADDGNVEAPESSSQHPLLQENFENIGLSDSESLHFKTKRIDLFRIFRTCFGDIQNICEYDVIFVEKQITEKEEAASKRFLCGYSIPRSYGVFLETKGLT